MDNTSERSRSQGGATYLNGASHRRPQSLMSLIGVDRNNGDDRNELTITIQKDACGYGMKVSGDRPVFVESVKTGGAAHKAGLMEHDMIVKVNGEAAKTLDHPTVVHLIKDKSPVILTVSRVQNRMQRNSITAPLPVDPTTRREVEFNRINTLRMMWEQETKNLENLKASSNINHSEVSKAEMNILRLGDQLRLLQGEDPKMPHYPSIAPSNFLNVSATSSSSSLKPAFLSHFPRSLSSLSLGGRKKVDKDAISPAYTTAEAAAAAAAELRGDKARSPSIITEHQPPPLPQRNFARRSQPSPTTNDNIDGDITGHEASPVVSGGAKKKGKNEQETKSNNNTYYNEKSGKLSTTPNKSVSSTTSAASSKVKKRSKTKIKANSDPKISAQQFIQMERDNEADTSNRKDLIAATGHSVASEPPPLPPRQPGMLEENQNLLNNNKCAASTASGTPPSGRTESRPSPNSLDTRMLYPLIATATAVRDNSTPFPLSNRPNILQRLQQSHQHALGLTPHQINQLNATSPHRRVVSSPDHIHSRDSDTFDDEITPPGTPPPPYKNKQSKSSASDGKNPMVPKRNFMPAPNQSDQKITEQDDFTDNHDANISGSQPNILQRQIISMEDDEYGDDQDSISDDHGPFKSLPQLLEQENTPHLAVFLNFVLSNSNPSQLLFYLITGLYKEGSLKDMRKWAYEIHSTFLVPRAPLMWENVDESLAREVDDVLQKEHDKSEILRQVFFKSRQKAKECISQQLFEFQTKRTAGLGTMFGPSDQQLQEAKGDKLKEHRIVEEKLMPKLQQLLDDLEKDGGNECPKKLALSSALSTVLSRIFLVTRSMPGGLTERVHHFVSREKSFKSRLTSNKKKIMVRGHNLGLKQYYEVAHCNHCQNIIWGVGPQGYHCANCELNIHRACSRVLEEDCPGPVATKNGKIGNIFEKIRPFNHFNPGDRSRRQDDDCALDESIQSDRPSSASVVRQPSDRRTDLNSSTNSTTQNNHSIASESSTAHSIDIDTSVQDAICENRDSTKSKSAPVSVNRSESYKERLSQRNHRSNRRKTSDPSLSSKSNDEHNVEIGAINNANFAASSSSSLSSSGLGSPSTSLEAVGTTGQQGVVTCTPKQWEGSDDETGELEADWSSHVSADILHTLTDSEKRRQEIINEIYQTERNHVRTLRLLEGIFMRPLQESQALTAEHFNLLFPPSLLVLKDLHTSFEQQLKQRRTDHSPLVKTIGDLLLTMFDGNAGTQLREHAAQFCARQKIALEALKEKRRKDENLQRLLTKAESHKACRRLQLKDLLPTVLQRLTKYPLLFDGLGKITNKDNEKEAHAIQQARELSRRILDHVNQSVREAEDAHTLQTIQKRLDRSPYEKEPNNEFKNLDLTQHKLIYEGPLVHRRQPREQLHGLLFETMLVLLHKQDDKYILKYLVSPTSGESRSEVRFNPITKINLILVRQSATERNTFYFINTTHSQSPMLLELTAPSALECKTWHKHISTAVEAFKQRTKTTHDISTPVEEPLSSTPKEQIENEINASIAANTTISTTNTTTTSDNPQNQSFDGRDSQKDVARHIDADGETNEKEKDREVNGDNSSAANKSPEDDVCDNKFNKQKHEYSNVTSNMRMLTQQSSLVAPSEVLISISPSLKAEPVLTPNERLKRLDESIRHTLAEKQDIVCNIFGVPNKHFSAIADIAGQPEAPKEPSDILLAAFAQVQSLIEALNGYIKAPLIQPSDILVKSASLCDDCFKTAEQQLSERQQLEQKQKQLQQTSPSETNSPTTVINNKAAEALNADDAILPDDDGYCNIDEIRLPAIPLKLSPAIRADARRQSAPAPLPPASDASRDEPSLKSITESLSETTTQNTVKLADISPAASMEKLPNSSSSTDQSLSISSNSISKADEHIEVNYAYDSLSQPLSELNLNSLGSINIVEDANATACMKRTTETPSIPSIPVHIISTYVSAINQHISQLLPKLNERDTERDTLRKENQLLRDRLNALHEREQTTQAKS